MNRRITNILTTDRAFEITATGCKRAKSHHAEIRLHSLGGKLCTTGIPTHRRGCYVNPSAQPNLEFYPKQSAWTETDAYAPPILDEDVRQVLLEKILATIDAERDDNNRDLDDWCMCSPLVEVTLQEASA